MERPELQGQRSQLWQQQPWPSRPITRRLADRVKPVVLQEQ